MGKKSLKILDHKEIKQVSGGFHHKKTVCRAASGAAVKALGYYIGCLLPGGEKGTFTGELWNGAAKAAATFTSALAIFIPLAGMFESKPHND